MNYDGKNIYKNIISGGIAGSISLTFTYPTEVIKTKMQYEKSKSFFHIFSNHFRNYGIRGLYSGYLPTLLSIIPRAGINYSSYEYIYFKFKTNGNDSKFYNLLSGISAGAISGLLLTTPIENIKTYNIFYSQKNYNLPTTLRNIYQEKGMKGFFRGFYPTIAKESTTYGVRFFVYTEIFHQLDNYNLFIRSVISSGIAGFISCYCNNPLDVIQTRKQLPVEHNNTIIDILRREGLGVLWKGSFIRAIRTIPGAMISFLSYEFVCKKLFYT